MGRDELQMGVELPSSYFVRDGKTITIIVILLGGVCGGA
jgi:hypothetical protein